MNARFFHIYLILVIVLPCLSGCSSLVARKVIQADIGMIPEYAYGGTQLSIEQGISGFIPVISSPED